MLAQGEAIIRKGCVAHNQLRFYPDAIDVALELGEWDEAQRYAAALEDLLGLSPSPGPTSSRARRRSSLSAGAALTTARNQSWSVSKPKRAASTIAPPAADRAGAGQL